MTIELDRPMEIMRDARTIAVVGISSDPMKPSNDVSRYLLDAGYRLYFVNPMEREVFGQPVYARLQDVPEPIDIVDVFRRPEFLPEVAVEAVEAGAKVFWTQLALVNEEAAATARAGGLEVVMDRCTKIEHARLQRALRAEQAAR